MNLICDLSNVDIHVNPMYKSVSIMDGSVNNHHDFFCINL